MKKVAVVIITVIFASTLRAESNTVTVEISGIKEITGQISIGLFNQPDCFPNKDKAYRGAFVKVEENSATYIFSGVPSGDYAIAIFHDSNNNGNLDRNFLGVPKEGYAFSKNAKGTFGPPNFDKAKFRLDGNYIARIKMDY